MLLMSVNFSPLRYNLSEEERQKRQERFELFDKCCDQMGYYSIKPMDFFIQYYGYDRTTPYAIITSKENAYEEYFNWLLEGYEVHCLRPILLSEERGFYYPEQNSDIITKELALKDEALEIRGNTLTRELKKYYR